MAAAAPAATECSQGSEDSDGKATAADNVLSTAVGYLLFWITFDSYAAVKASSMATFNMAKARDAAFVGRGVAVEMSASISFHRNDGDQKSQ